MRSSENKEVFFAKESTMVIIAVIAMVASIAQAVMSVFARRGFLCFELVLNFLCVLFLVISYKRHDKNVMKGLLGAILVLFVTKYANTFFTYIYYPDIMVQDLVLAGIPVVLTLLIAINHFIINSDHHSNPAKIRLNQVLLIVLIVYNTLMNIFYAVLAYDSFTIASYIISAITFLASFGVLIWIETKLDFFRVRREEKA